MIIQRLAYGTVKSIYYVNRRRLLPFLNLFLIDFGLVLHVDKNAMFDFKCDI